jgi:hypothetical protein
LNERKAYFSLRLILAAVLRFWNGRREVSTRRGDRLFKIAHFEASSRSPQEP